MSKKQEGPPEEGFEKEREQRSVRLVRQRRGDRMRRALRDAGMLVEAQQPKRPEKDLEINFPVGKGPFDYVRFDMAQPRDVTFREEFIRSDAPMKRAYQAARSSTWGLLEAAREGKREDLQEYEVRVHTYEGSKFHVVRMKPDVVTDRSGPARVALVHVDMSGRGYALYTTIAAFTDETLTQVKRPEVLRAAMGEPLGPFRGGLYLIKPPQQPK